MRKKNSLQFCQFNALRERLQGSIPVGTWTEISFATQVLEGSTGQVHRYLCICVQSNLLPAWDKPLHLHVLSL